MKRFKKVYVEITNLCNLSCSFCANSARKKEYINPQNFRHILTEIKPFTDYIYLHILGEPLTHPYLKDILKLAAEYSFNVNLTTNGTLLSGAVNVLTEFPVRQINISLHSFPDFGEPLNKYLETVIDCAKQINNSTPTLISFRLWDITNETMPRQADILNKLKTSFSNFTEDFNKNRITIKKNIYLSLEKPFEWPSINKPVVTSFGTCRGLKDMCGILSDGTVTACCLDYDGAINLGNIYKESFKKIITGQKADAIIKGFNNNSLTQPICQKCTFRQRFN